MGSSKVEEAPAAPVEAAKPKKAKKKIVIEEVDSSKVEEAPAAPVEAAKPKKAKKKIVIEEVDSSVDDLEKEVSDAMNAVNGILDCEAPTETPKKAKKKI